MKYIIGIFFFALVSLSSAVNAGGGWTKEKGKLFLKLNQSVLRTDRFFTPAGEPINITTTGLFTTSLYGEYGITDRLEASVFIPFFVRSTLNQTVSSATNDVLAPGDQVNNIGEISVGLKYKLFSNEIFSTSFSVRLGLPTGDNTGGNSELLQTGDGEFNQLFTFDVSASIPASPVYISAFVGFNNRTNATFEFEDSDGIFEVEEPFSEEIQYGLEVGLTPGKWVFVGRISGTQSLNNTGSINSFNSIFGNNTESFIFSPEVAYKVLNTVGISFSPSVSLDAGNLGGRRVLGGTTYNFGVFLDL